MSSAAAEATTTWGEGMAGLAEESPGTEMPYSISVPMIRRAVTGPPAGRRRTVRAAEPCSEPSRGQELMKVQPAPDPAQEPVAVFDPAGEVIGVAPRGE